MRHDRRIVLGALLLLIALAWAYVVHLSLGMTIPAESMPGMDMSSMPGMAMTPTPQPWSIADLLFAFVMWSVMMVGMMAPSFAPTVLLYAAIGRMAAAHNRPFAATGWFASGYFLAWTIFSLAAAMAQIALSHALLLNPMLKSASLPLSGAVLIIAGLYQFSPWKTACLTQCREPMFFIQRHGGFRPQAKASVILGLRHGLYCIGCCWALMLLLFVLGVMNLFWIAALAAAVLLEKVWRHGVIVSRALGVAAIAGGLILIGQYLV